MAPKARYDVNFESVAAVLAAHAEKPDFLVYGEDLAKTAVNAKQIVATKALWRAVSEVHPTLQISQSQSEHIMRMVAKICASTWARPHLR